MDWVIGKRERTTFLDARGRGMDGYQVWFQMDDGTIDYVEVEKSQYNAEAVNRQIEESIERHEAVVRS